MVCRRVFIGGKKMKRYIKIINSIVTNVIHTWKKPTDDYIENYNAKICQIQQEDGTFRDLTEEERETYFPTDEVI